jgi:hypothetical protein
VKWKGYGEKDTTWEPVEFLTHCNEMIEDYHKNKPHSELKPPPTKGRNETRNEGEGPESKTSLDETGSRGSVVDPALRRSQRLRTGVLSML